VFKALPKSLTAVSLTVMTPVTKPVLAVEATFDTVVSTVTALSTSTVPVDEATFAKVAPAVATPATTEVLIASKVCVTPRIIGSARDVTGVNPEFLGTSIVVQVLSGDESGRASFFSSEDEVH
jgi:hypothetical protein